MGSDRMIFINSPFDILDKAFHNLYPEKTYKACIDPNMTDEKGELVYGYTQFVKDDVPVIAISADLSIKNAVEVFAHELAHVAAGEGEGHSKIWEKEFDKIYDEYHRVGDEMFGGRR